MSLIHDFVDHFLVTVKKTRRILQLECDEARFVLKPWEIEFAGEQTVCDCEKVRKSIISIQNSSQI